MNNYAEAEKLVTRKLLSSRNTYATAVTSPRAQLPHARQHQLLQQPAPLVHPPNQRRPQEQQQDHRQQRKY